MVEGLGQNDVRRGVEEARMNSGDWLVGLIEQRVAPQNLHEFIGERGGGNLNIFRGALELVDLALEFQEAGTADGLPGSLDELLLLVADEGKAQKAVQVR